jgi:hypothetical protein
LAAVTPLDFSDDRIFSGAAASMSFGEKPVPTVGMLTGLLSWLVAPSAPTMLMPLAVVTFSEPGSTLKIEIASVPNLSVYVLIALDRLLSVNSELSERPGRRRDDVLGDLR